MGASLKGILDSASGVGVGIAYAVPGGDAAAACLMGADALVDLFWPQSQDPADLAVSESDLNDAVSAISAAIFAQASDVHIVNLLTLNGQINEAFQHYDTPVSPFFVGDFPNNDGGLAYNQWVDRMQQYIDSIVGPAPPTKQAITFASSYPDKIYLTLDLYLLSVQTYFQLSKFVVSYLLNQTARNRKVMELANDPDVIKWKQDSLTWKINGKKGPQPTQPGCLSGIVPDADLLVLQPFVFDASSVANDAIKYLNSILANYQTILDSVDSVVSTRNSQLIPTQLPNGDYCYYDNLDMYETIDIGARSIERIKAVYESGDPNDVENHRQAALATFRSNQQASQIANNPDLDFSPDFKTRITNIISTYSQSQTNCLDFIKTINTPHGARPGSDGHGT